MACCHRRTSHEITGCTIISMAYVKQTDKSAAHQKMSKSLDINMIHRACHINLHDTSFRQVLMIIAKWQKKDLPCINQRLPGPVGTNKQCNA